MKIAIDISKSELSAFQQDALRKLSQSEIIALLKAGLEAESASFKQNNMTSAARIAGDFARAITSESVSIL